MADFCNHIPRKPKVVTPKVAKKRHPNIVAIFEKQYRVMVMQGNLHSIEYIREMGTLGSGDPNIDHNQQNTLVPIYITINTMVEYFRDSINLYMTPGDDSKNIYEAIVNHTSVWRAALRDAFNIGSAPIEDLILMEQFAASVYENAKFEYFDKPQGTNPKGSLADFLYNGSGLRGTMYSGTRNKMPELQSSSHTSSKWNPHVQKHNPDIDIFRDALMRSIGADNDNT